MERPSQAEVAVLAQDVRASWHDVALACPQCVRPIPTTIFRAPPRHPHAVQGLAGYPVSVGFSRDVREHRCCGAG
jgi:hypothetical protein